MDELKVVVGRFVQR